MREFTDILEKSRVVFVPKNERNFHIFYQMIAGLEPEELRTYHFFVCLFVCLFVYVVNIVVNVVIIVVNIVVNVVNVVQRNFI
jgi:hypothetical protein